jgi:PAS domain S-box-containing protein
MSSKNQLSLKNTTKEKLNPSLYEKAEKILQLKEETRVNSDKKYSLLEMQEICHDLEVHEIELEMQNEELIHTYQELDNSNKRYFDFYNLAPVGYLTLSEEGLILEANLTSSTLLGISTQILIQKPVSHFILQEDQDIYYLYNKSFSDQTKQPSCELRMLHSDGTSFWVQLESSTQNSDGIVLHRLIISPINERKKAQEELRIAAIAFKSQNGMAITDADGIIERINPAFTALTGYSEEEAATLANQLGEKIFESMQKPFFLKTRDYYAQMSIGVTLLNSDDTVEDLFKHADIALYQAKNSGRNTLRFFDPTMQATLDLHSALEAELREALSKNQFRLYYQPQVDELHRVGGVEALIRWLHPERGLISPDDFIPLAEESDLILPIGLWVLQTACEQLKIWKNNPYTAQLNVAVNVSSRQFRQPDFVAQIQQVLQNCGVNPSLLKLELTESLVLENVEETIQKMAAIQHLGVNFSMDDFGTGFSSLSYLAQLPLNQLKIDKSFVNKIFEHRDNEMIARTIIAMGIGLGMNVIAEGVETIAQQKFLEASGCLFYQGYLFSRPLPIEELEVYLQQN